MAIFGKPSGDAALVKQLLRQLQSAEKHADEINRLKDRAQKVYLGQTSPMYGKPRQNGDWRSRLFPPVAFEHIEMMIANVCDSPPEFDPTARLDKYAHNTESVSKAMRYHLERDQFPRKYRTAMRRVAKYGDVPVKIVWKRDMCTVDEHRMDPETGAMLAVEVEYPCFDGPTILVMDYRDWFPDPTGRMISECGWVIQRWRATTAELASAKNSDGTPKYKNLDKLTTGGSAEQRSSKHDNETQESVEARTLQMGIHTLHERWTRHGVLIVANRSVVIYQDEDPADPVFKHGKIPFEVIRMIEDEDNLGGVSIPLRIEQLQEAHWKFLNELVNAITLAVRPPILVDEESDASATKIVIAPDANIPTRNGEQTVKVMKDIAGLDKYGMQQLMDATRDMIERTTGMNAVVGGMFHARSATQSSNALSQAMKRLTHQIEVSDDDWSRVVEMMFELVQQFGDAKVESRLAGGEQVVFGPDELRGNFMFESKLSTEKSMREQRQNSLSQLYNMIAPTIQPGTVEYENLEGLFKAMTDAYQAPDLGVVTLRPPQVAMEQAQTQMQVEAMQAQAQAQLPQPQQPQQAAAPAPESTPPHETISMAYDKTPPSIQRQIEAAAGFKPATTEESAIQVAALKKASQPATSNQGKQSSGSKS